MALPELQQTEAGAAKILLTCTPPRSYQHQGPQGHAQLAYQQDLQTYADALSRPKTAKEGWHRAVCAQPAFIPDLGSTGQPRRRARAVQAGLYMARLTTARDHID